MSVPTRVSIIPAGNPNRSGRILVGGKPAYLTWHETANRKPGANAEMHRKFVHGGGGADNVSFHFVVDELESIQLLPTNEVAWHAGDGPNGTGNTRSLAIELCVNAGADWNRTLANATELGRKLMKDHSIPVDRCVQHATWSGKDCPHDLRLKGWLEFRAGLGEREFPTGFVVRNEFLGFFDANGGVRVFGYPITEERDEVIAGTMYRVQWFERARFELHGNQIMLGLVGAELLETLGRFV